MSFRMFSYFCQLTNYIFSETAARGLYRRWADLLIHDTWEDVEKAAEEYEKELMKWVRSV